MSRKDPIREQEYQRTYYLANKARLNAKRVHLDHIHGIHRPIMEAKDCSAYLGIIIAERVLSKFFDHTERMPPNNPGYDFICGRGKRIDAKSACLYYGKGRDAPRWDFSIRYNTKADYFLCLAFDNRENLKPMHVWLIPGELINRLSTFGMANSPKSLAKWSKYERPLDRVIACCDTMKSNG